MKYQITESDAITGTTIEREANAAEIADIMAREKKIKDIKDAEAAVQAGKASALAKLETLGLTPDEVAALLA